MSTPSVTSPSEDPPNVTAGILARGAQILVMFIIMGLELFLGSGHLNWRAAWVYLGISLISLAINAVFMLRLNPETVAERGRPKEMKGWDKLIGGMWLLGQYILIPLAAAFDLRFNWTREFATGWQVVGACVYALAVGLSGWAMISNAYFSTAVRIQVDRGQQVCRSGPYHFVRHPGYVGFFFQALSVPILLGSLWALLFAIPVGMLMVIRTVLEDRMLQEELAGYKEYTQEVKYRLFPGVW
jgi:protein-S-isoprenylcysteine O-methyltransferase Ste14